MNLRHILTKKSSKRKRKLRKAGYVAAGPVYDDQEEAAPVRLIAVSALWADAVGGVSDGGREFRVRRFSI